MNPPEPLGMAKHRPAPPQTLNQKLKSTTSLIAPTGSQSLRWWTPASARATTSSPSRTGVRQWLVLSAAYCSCPCQNVQPGNHTPHANHYLSRICVRRAGIAEPELIKIASMGKCCDRWWSELHAWGVKPGA